MPLEEIPSAVRALANDRVRRTIYRLLWSLDEVNIPILIEGGSVKPDALPPEELAQILFLGAWMDFLRGCSSADAKESLELWNKLDAHEGMAHRLAEILVSEDGISASDAEKDVRSAKEAVTRHLIERIATEAVTAFEAGNLEPGARLTFTILTCPLDRHIKETSLEPLADYARRIEGQVREATQALREWSYGDPIPAPYEVSILATIVSLLDSRHPAAPMWSATLTAWQTRVIHVMLDEVRYRNELGQHAEALNVAFQARDLQYDTEFSEQLPDLIADLQAISRGEAPVPRGGSRSARENELSPMKRAPGLFNYRGFGTCLYGKRPYEADPRYHFSIVYLTVVFIPVIPLGRYLVEPLGKDRWMFVAKAKWTLGMKIYFVVACLLIWLWYSQYYVHAIAPKIHPTQI